MIAPPDTASGGVRISLSAVVVALRDGEAAVLTSRGEGEAALPSGPFDPLSDRTFELALRAFVTTQTGFGLGFVEQLYTFGDAGRSSPKATQGPERRREVSVGYLALTAEPGAASADRWSPIFDHFPWEDRRGAGLDPALLEALDAWAGRDPRRRARIEALFALGGRRWNEERALERYELLYEAGLVAEAARDQDRPAQDLPTGRPMASDHRRILATGLGRLRSKLKYRPVLFDLTPETFTLSQLQAAAEAVTGLTLHKQNFRRGVERTGLVKATGALASATGGRPAELYRSVGADPLAGATLGLTLPAQR
nr:NAD regulator [Brevundimonas sp. Leaf363]